MCKNSCQCPVEELHLTPINTTVQLRPGFKYIDKIDEKWKAANKRIQDVEKLEEKKRGTDPNTAQTVQVSVKNTEREGNMRKNLYSMAVRNAEEEDWQPIVYYDENVSWTFTPSLEHGNRGLTWESCAVLSSRSKLRKWVKSSTLHLKNHCFALQQMRTTLINWAVSNQPNKNLTCCI